MAVDEEARAWYEQVKETINSASIGMKTILSNSPNEDISEQIETNKSNEVGSSEGGKVRRRNSQRPGKQRNHQTQLKQQRQTMSGEHVLSRSPKKIGGEEACDIDTATTMACVTVSTSEKSSQQRKKENNHDKTELPAVADSPKT